MPDLHSVLTGAAIGIGATLTMDAWLALLKSAFGVRSLNYCLLGRWIRGMPATLRHDSIAAAEPRKGECPVGWAAHYSIGISLTVAFIVISGPRWLAAPTLPPALIFGVVTVIFPYFVLQPALGFGVASSRAPDPMRARLKSLGTHLVFGLGVWLWAVVMA